MSNLLACQRFMMGKHLRNDHDHGDRCDNVDDHCDYEEVDGGDVDLHCKVQVGPAPDHEIENSDHHDDLEVDNSEYHDNDSDHNYYQAIGKSGLKRRRKTLVPKKGLDLTHFFHRIFTGKKTNNNYGDEDFSNKTKAGSE